MSDDVQRFPPSDNVGSERPSRSYEWPEIFQLAVFEASIETYRDLLRDPKAELSRALIWMFFAGVLSGVISSVLQSMGLVSFGYLGVPGGTTGGDDLVLNLILSPFTALFVLIGTLAGAGIQHLIAGALGGSGNFRDLYYISASYGAPLVLVFTFVGYYAAIDILLGTSVYIYGVILNAVALRTIYGFNWSLAIGTIAIQYGVGIGLFICFILMLVSAAS